MTVFNYMIDRKVLFISISIVSVSALVASFYLLPLATLPIIFFGFILSLTLYQRNLGFRRNAGNFEQFRNYILRSGLPKFTESEIEQRERIITELSSNFLTVDDILNLEKQTTTVNLEQIYGKKLFEKSFLFFVMKNNFHLTEQEKLATVFLNSTQLETKAISFLKIFVLLGLFIVMSLVVFAYFNFKALGLL